MGCSCGVRSTIREMSKGGNMRALLLSLAAAAFSASASAGTWTWVAGATDWDSEDSYDEAGKPGQGDTVKIPAGATAAVDNDSIAFVSSLGKIYMPYSTSALTIEISTNATLGCQVTGMSNVSKEGSGTAIGTVTKRGAGELFLAVGGTSNSYRSQYYVNWNIEGGSIRMPTNNASSTQQLYFGAFTVNDGTTLYTAKPGRTRVAELWGSGLVTNETTSSYYLDVYGFTDSGRTRPCVFSGVIGGGIYLYSRGNVNFIGTNNTFRGNCWAWHYNSSQTYGTSGFKTLGMAGQPSSAGMGDGFRTREYSGRFLYLGTGETTDRTFQFDESSYRPCEFDAGAVGGITFRGKWDDGTYSDSMVRIVITGSNTLECVLDNAFATHYGYRLTKKGSGTWRLAHNDSRNIRGVVAVQDGTLKFDSIAEKGAVCSLGLSNILYADYTGVKSDDKKVDYALLIGGDSSKTGTLEYAGAADAACTTRSLALKGAGRFRVSGGTLYLGGVFADNGGGTLIYDSANGADVTNTLANVKDGTNGVLSIVKEGAGTLALSGEQSWSGDLDVRQGTVLVDSHYSYFRLTMKENAYACSRYDTSACTDDSSAKKSFQVCEFSLFDANGLRQNKGLTTANEMTTQTQADTSALTLNPGEAAIENGASFKYYNGGTAYRLNQLFDDTLKSGWNNGIVIYHGNSGLPYITTPERHCKVVMRLTNQNEIVYYDICSSRGTNDTKSFGRCLTAYSIDGSADGRVWEEVAKDDAVELKTGSPHWYGATHTSLKIERRLAFTNVASVAVAPGAKLVANGPVAPIKKLVVDADAGIGTIEGFDFAEEGTIEIGSMSGKSSVRIPAELLNTDTLANVSNWTIVSDGKPRKWRVDASPDGITVVKSGMVIVVE